MDVLGRDPQSRDDRQRQDRDAIFVGEPGEIRAEKHEAAHQERHGRGARSDVGGKEGPSEGRDEQAGDGERVGDRQRHADPRRHPVSSEIGAYHRKAMNAAPIRMFSPARTRICKDALRAGSSAMVWATTPCAFQSPIRTAAKGTAASRRGIHSDRTVSAPTGLWPPCAGRSPTGRDRRTSRRRNGASARAA